MKMSEASWCSSNDLDMFRRYPFQILAGLLAIQTGFS